MKKKIILGSILFTAALSFNGCGSSGSGDDSNSKENLLDVEISSDQTTITINWTRTENVIYYMHTDLTASNSKYDAQQIAKTNSTEKITFTCSKDLETSSYVNYICSVPNTYGNPELKLTLNEKTNLEERGIYSSTEHGQLILGYFQYNNGNLEFIKN